jgi:translation elongation factor EF-G
MEQLAEGSGIEFESVIKNGAILKPFASSLEKGVREQLQNGDPLGGYKYPVTDIKITLVDGKMHSVDSKDKPFNQQVRKPSRQHRNEESFAFCTQYILSLFLSKTTCRATLAVLCHATRDSLEHKFLRQQSTKVQVEAILPATAIESVSTSLRKASAGSVSFASGLFSLLASHY